MNYRKMKSNRSNIQGISRPINISKLLPIAILLFVFGNLSAQDSLWERKYQFSVYNKYDLRNSAENAITVHRMLNDGFRKGIKPLMGNNLEILAMVLSVLPPLL